ncbi:PIG-X / PBN1 [Pelomyxa schiedti]|nr:PIG-X / PBN1 [Pelomyxa schiedti]
MLRLWDHKLEPAVLLWVVVLCVPVFGDYECGTVVEHLPVSEAPGVSHGAAVSPRRLVVLDVARRWRVDEENRDDGRVGGEGDSTHPHYTYGFHNVVVTELKIDIVDTPSYNGDEETHKCCGAVVQRCNDGGSGAISGTEHGRLALGDGDIEAKGDCAREVHYHGDAHSFSGSSSGEMGKVQWKSVVEQPGEERRYGEVLIIDSLGSDVFVDVYQIENEWKRRPTNYRIHSLAGVMDLEKPSTEVPKWGSFVVVSLQITNDSFPQTIRAEVPIHSRYQPPSNSSHYKAVTIPAPVVLIQSFHDPCWQLHTAEQALKGTVPVGDLNLQSTVALLTLTITTLGALLFVLLLMCVPMDTPYTKKKQ